jgi:hypothetical protein
MANTPTVFLSHYFTIWPHATSTLPQVGTVSTVRIKAQAELYPLPTLIFRLFGASCTSSFLPSPSFSPETLTYDLHPRGSAC